VIPVVNSGSDCERSYTLHAIFFVFGMVSFSLKYQTHSGGGKLRSSASALDTCPVLSVTALVIVEDYKIDYRHCIRCIE